ncbi:helix-turn-helix domain-containing protein [Pyxidicoccus sp. 3LFB2]
MDTQRSDTGSLLASPRPRLGLRVEFETAGPGEMSIEATPDHRLKLHVGTPLRGACRFHRFVYTQGDIDICPAGESDVWHTQDAGASVLVWLPPALLRRAAEDMGMDPDRAGLEPRHQFRDPQIEHIAWALDADRKAGNPGGLLYTECLGLALSVRLLGQYPAPLERERGLSKPQLRRVTEYIEAHLDQNLSLARLAGVAGVSASHLKTLFKRSTGLPVHEFVVQRRVERARTLLQAGALSAGEVALEAGFSHQSHMARCMRRVLGVTPSVVARAARAR